jgi:hypothetical protein
MIAAPMRDFAGCLYKVLGEFQAGGKSRKLSVRTLAAIYMKTR